MATSGTYRIRHCGVWKNGANGLIFPYQGTTPLDGVNLQSGTAAGIVEALDAIHYRDLGLGRVNRMLDSARHERRVVECRSWGHISIFDNVYTFV